MLKRVSYSLILLFLFYSISYATFTVYLTNGTPQEVSRVYFYGDKADLFLLSGAKMTVPINSIDFQKTGLARPTSQVSTVYGTSHSGTAVTGLTQDQLQ